MLSRRKITVLFIGLIILIVGISMYLIRRFPNLTMTTLQPADQNQTDTAISGTFDKTQLKSDAQWKKILTTEQYHILREQGTEIPFTGKLDYETRKGTYYSVGCNEPVFRSEQKYDSGTGWPSFWAPINSNALVLREDDSLGEKRIEVLDKCGGHLGHLFNDGPLPTGNRYCMNSVALKFVPDKIQ